MKKKNFKFLKLNKKSISNLRAGNSIIKDPTTDTSNFGSYVDIFGCNSAKGCTGGPDETMTCPLWSCSC